MLVNSIPAYIVHDIAANYLKATGRIPREFGFYPPLFDFIVKDCRAGTMNKLRLANRAIANFEKAHTLESVL